MKPKSLLIIEDNRALSMALSALGERNGLTPTIAPTLARAREQLRQTSFDLVLLDIGLPDGKGLDLLQEHLFQNQPLIAVISAHGELENAIAARKLGVTHFFDKPIDFDALEKFLTEYSQHSPPTLEATSSASPTPPFIGASKSMRPVFQQIAQACTTHHPVVIRGETGTGKSHVAHLIQLNTTPAEHRSLNVTPHTTNEEIIQALKEAAGHSLIIENIQTLPLPIQHTFITTLDHLGEKAPRLLVTIDADGLHHQVLTKAMDPDLYYRLQVLEISLPLLSDRHHDIPALAAYFLGELDPTTTRQLSPALLDTLQSHSWPGNLRELRNVISYLIVSNTESALLTPDHLPPYFQEDAQKTLLPKDDLNESLEHWVTSLLTDQDPPPAYREIHADLEYRLLNILLQRYNNKPSHLAQALSINRVTLRKKLQREHTKSMQE